MGEMLWIILSLLLPIVLSEYRLVCYYANWAPYRDLRPILYPDDIDPKLCSHIHFAFARINPKTLEITPTEKHDTEWLPSSGPPLYFRMSRLKMTNIGLKTILSIGGWNAKSTGFNAASKNDKNRRKFATQAIKFLRMWNWDGMDLDWEYPGDLQRGAAESSKNDFHQLLRIVRDEITKESMLSGREPLLISSAVSANPLKVIKGYDVKEFCHLMDYVNIMTYDYHGPWDNVTGSNSPLYNSINEESTSIKKTSNVPNMRSDENVRILRSMVETNEYEKHQDKTAYDKDNSWKNANYSIFFWIRNGCPPKKLHLGIAAYGRTFIMNISSLNSNLKRKNYRTEIVDEFSGNIVQNNSTIRPPHQFERNAKLFSAIPNIGTPIISPGKSGRYSKEPGVLTYYEVCEQLYIKRYKREWLSDELVPYAYKNDEFVSFDDSVSVYHKVKYVKSLGLGGVMLWTSDMDDYSGRFCYAGPFPITRTIRMLLNANNTDTNKKNSYSTNTTRRTSTPFQTTSISIKKEKRKQKNSHNDLLQYEKAFNEIHSAADFIKNYRKNNKMTTTRPTTTTKLTTRVNFKKIIKIENFDNRPKNKFYYNTAIKQSNNNNNNNNNNININNHQYYNEQLFEKDLMNDLTSFQSDNDDDDDDLFPSINNNNNPFLYGYHNQFDWQSPLLNGLSNRYRTTTTTTTTTIIPSSTISHFPNAYNLIAGFLEQHSNFKNVKDSLLQYANILHPELSSNISGLTYQKEKKSKRIDSKLISTYNNYNNNNNNNFYTSELVTNSTDIQPIFLTTNRNKMFRLVGKHKEKFYDSQHSKTNKLFLNPKIIIFLYFSHTCIHFLF
ncbi:hypothetical protein SNEBB_009970 [Seison nebaliae]|nr:hypothetical protein SNEBB_009970 [Seison nebaliae]